MILELAVSGLKSGPIWLCNVCADFFSTTDVLDKAEY
jgi:hypothetical protein